MADDGRAISFSELVNVRKEEMQNMLPGFMAEVKMGDKSAIVKSPSYFEKSKYKVKEQ